MNKLLLSLTGAAAGGALVLVSPSGWSPRVRWAYVVVPSVLLAGGSSLFLTKIAARPAETATGAVPARRPQVRVPARFPSALPWLFA